MKDGLLAIVKFFCFLLMLPIVIAVAISFENHLMAIPIAKSHWLYWGGGVFIAFFLFLYNFQEVHAIGQGVVTKLLGFMGAAAAPFSLVVPIIAVLLVSAYLILSTLKLLGPYEPYLLMLISFAITMHLVLVARQLFDEDKGPIKANYLLSFGVVFVVNLCFFSLLLALVVQEFSSMDFFKFFINHAQAYYQHLYRLLFVSPS